jgi:hypothetical protein
MINTTMTNILQHAKQESTLGRQPLIAHFSDKSGPMGPNVFDENADPKKIYRFIVGKDTLKPQSMSQDEADKWLKDPFAELLLKQNIFPLTANKVIEEFEKTKETQNGLKKFTVSHIAEGGQIPWNTATDKMNRTFRLVLALDVKGGIGTDVFISTGIDVDSEKQFLQLMSWDTTNRAFNFYQRLHSFWIWSGNSFHALETETRNKGPFSGHINGGPIMKELKIPWQNWSSMNAKISSIVLPPDHPFLKHRFFIDTTLFTGGEQLEKIIKATIGHINNSRIRQINEGKVNNFDYFLRQILETKNLNLTSSSIASQSINDNTKVVLPITFFANFDALSELDLEIDVEPIVITGKIYKENLKKFDFALESDGVRLSGDTHFAFLVPEPAFEDADLLSKMVEKEMISKKLAACLLMVDFTNPVFSTRRASLLSYAPKEITVGKRGADLDEKFVKSVLSSGKDTQIGTPEEEFIANWKLSDEKWNAVFTDKIVGYFTCLQKKAQTQEGYDDIVRLAESRRALFKKTKLYEFPLTFPVSNISMDALLEMKPEGIVQPIKHS